MRLASDEELEQASQLALWGGLKGGLLTGSLMGCGLYIFERNRLQRQSKLFPLQTKVFLLTASVLGGFGFFGERAILKLERQKRHERLGIDAIPSQTSERIDQQVWKNLLYHYRYPIIVGSWAGTLGFCLYQSLQIPNLKFSQKLIHARMKAQAVTLIAILGIVFLVSNDQKRRSQGV